MDGNADECCLGGSCPVCNAPADVECCAGLSVCGDLDEPDRLNGKPVCRACSNAICEWVDDVKWSIDDGVCWVRLPAGMTLARAKEIAEAGLKAPRCPTCERVLEGADLDLPEGSECTPCRQQTDCDRVSDRVVA